MGMIRQKEFKLETEDGVKTYVLHKIPYLAGGREVCTQFIPTGLPKVGDYKRNEELAQIIFSYVDVITEAGTPIRLTTKDLVGNHVPDFQTGVKIEKEMLEFNFGFFDTGKIYASLKSLAQQHQAKILPILMEYLEPLLVKAKPPSKN